MMLANKRKRAQNFTQDEKLRFIRLLQEHGQCILTKVTSSDMKTNKEKEGAWLKIIEYHNATANVKRTTDTLKKLWQKLKSDAKTFKARSRYATGTGGGPSKSLDDPILDLVVEITGRGSTGISMVQDCDAVDVIEDASIAGDAAVVCKTIIDVDDNNTYKEFPDNEIIIINNNGKEQEPMNQPSSFLMKGDETPKENKDWMKRRQPVLLNTNERSGLVKAKARLTNKFTAERLRVESEKSDLIALQKQQMIESHEIKMENEKLKKKLLESLIKNLNSGNNNAESSTVSTLSALVNIEDNIG